MEFFKNHTKRLSKALADEKPSRFRSWKSGKKWLYGLSVCFALLGTAGLVTPSLFSPMIVYAVTNGTIDLSTKGIIMNSGAVEAGNPQGRIYCIDESTVVEPNASATLSGTGSAAAGVTWASLSDTQRFQIQTLGWLSFNNPQASAGFDSNMLLAAQDLIWDITTGHGLPSSAATSFFGPNHIEEPIAQAWYTAAPGFNAATMSADMDYLLSLYQNFLKQPQFATTSQTIKIWQTATFTDSNNVLSAYGNISATNGLQASISGNNLLVTPTQAGTGTVTLSNGGKSGVSTGGVTVWFTNNPDGTVGQNIIAASAPPEQQIQVTVTAIPTAVLKITKLDTDTGKAIAGAVFEGLNKEGQVVTKDADGNLLPDGGKFTAAADGSITINNLMDDPTNAVGGEAQTIVTVREVSVPAPYTLSNNLQTLVGADGNAQAPSTDMTVTLVPGLTPTGITFSDKAQVQPIKVQKTATIAGKAIGNFPNGNYTLKDAVFTIKDETKASVIGLLYTDGKGLADLSTLAKTGDSHQSAAQYQAILNQMLVNGDTYSIQETQAPNGLACDWNSGKPQTFKLTASGDDTQLINPTVVDTTDNHTDTAITAATTLTKVDADTGNATTQGSGLLQGTIETLFYKVDVKDSSGKVVHAAGTPVQWTDGFSEKPIAVTSGKKIDNTNVTLQVTGAENSVGVENLPLTADSAQTGYTWKETDAKGNFTPGYGYTDNMAAFDVASGEGADGTGANSATTVLKGKDTQLTQADHVLTAGLEFTKVLGDSGSLTGEDGAVFQITPNDSVTKKLLDGVNGQNSQASSGDAVGSDGYTTAGLTQFKFAIGEWRIHQTVVPAGTKAVQDLLVSFAPNASTNGAPKTYTLTVKWADGMQIYTKTFKADDFTDAHSNLINLNLGTITDNKLITPSIATHAVDKSDGDQILGVGTVTGQDDSTIKNLVAGDYTEVTHWVDSATGEVITENGQPITATKDFTSTGSGKDKVVTEVQFSDIGLQGKSITAEEFVYHKGETDGAPVVSETDYKNNQKQTLKIQTAKGETQAQNAKVEIGNVRITDHYSGSGFEAGQAVTVKVDSVYDHTLDKELPAVGEMTLTADKDGNVAGNIEVAVDTSALENHELTFFESTYIDNQLVFQLHDKNALSETVTVGSPREILKPKGSTQVEQKTVISDKNASYTDDYYASNLTIGQRYTVKVPSLWDKTTEKEVEASGEVTFVATSDKMIIKVPVKVDSSALAGHDLVTFEDLYLNDSTSGQIVLLLQNHDKNADSETVHVNFPTDSSSTPQNILHTVDNLLPHTGDTTSWIPVGIGGGILLGLAGFLKRKALLRSFQTIKAKFFKRK